MKLRFALPAIFGVAVIVLATTPALAGGQTKTFLLELEVPNTAMAPNGDTVAITGEGQFSIFPNSVDAEGTFTHSNSGGTVLATGTWEATSLLTYQSFGCGVLFGETIPPEACGGRVLMSVLLTPAGTTLEIPAMLSVFCVIGDHVPASTEEGIRLSVPGIINFNNVTGGDNVYIQV